MNVGPAVVWVRHECRQDREILEAVRAGIAVLRSDVVCRRTVPVQIDADPAVRMDRIPFDREAGYRADRGDPVASVTSNQIGRRISGFVNGAADEVARGRSSEHAVAAVTE